MKAPDRMPRSEQEMEQKQQKQGTTDVKIYTCDPAIWEAEAGRSLVPGQLVYIVKLASKNKLNKNKVQ
jgi:hypothetical protein